MLKKQLSMEKLLFVAIIFVTILRLLSIWFSPLGLDVEEAQYWQWSTTPDFGYFTKPPMIAWVIGSSTFIFGETNFGVRALSPILQFVMIILIMKITAKVYTQRAGALAAILWITLPICTLGSQIISTDTPMLLFILAALFLLSPLALRQSISPQQATLAGIFTGLAMLSKYAAIYLPVGILLWWLWSGRHHNTVKLKHLLSYLFGTILTLLPNIIWNFNNGFVTALHLKHNANIEESKYSIINTFEFLLSQAAIVGPIIFVMVIASLIISNYDDKTKFWISLFTPAIFVISVQAFLSDANANWALASWPAALILLAGYCDAQWKNLRTPYLMGVGLNLGIAFVFLISVTAGGLGPLTPSSDPLRRLKAWDLHAQDILRFMKDHSSDQIVVTRRGQASKLMWELRNEDIKIKIIDGNGIPDNHFEHRFSWSPKSGQRSVFINNESTPPEYEGLTSEGQVEWLNIKDNSVHEISKKRERSLVMHLGLEK